VPWQPLRVGASSPHAGICSAAPEPVLHGKVNFNEVAAKINIACALSLPHHQMGINVITSSQAASGQHMTNTLEKGPC